MHSRCTGIANPWALNLLKSLELIWLDSLLSVFGDLQKRFLGNTSRDCRQVFSLLLQLEELRKQREMPVYLHAHFVGEHMIDEKVFKSLGHVNIVVF